MFHEDLEDNIWQSDRYLHPVDGNIGACIGYNFVNDQPYALDDNGHGTHVAGIISAVRNNEKGITGVAPEIKIMPIKVTGTDGNGTLSDIVASVISVVHPENNTTIASTNVSLEFTVNETALYSFQIDGESWQVISVRINAFSTVLGITQPMKQK